MVRHRIPSNSSETKANDRDPRGLHKKSSKKQSSGLIFWLKCFVCLSVVVIVAYYSYQGYLETLVRTPLKLASAVEKSGLSVPNRYWGSYRPGVYFGMKTRSPGNLLFGIMWMIPDQIKQDNLGLRHWCEQGDNLKSFGWLQHDGESFGLQEIQDRGLRLKTSFVKSSDMSWTSRIQVEQGRGKAKEVSLFLYAGMDENAIGYKLKPILSENGQVVGIVGKTLELGDFQLYFHTENAHVKQSYYSLIDSAGPQKFTDNVMQRLRLFNDGKSRNIGLDSQHMRSESPNLIVDQINVQVPFEIDVTLKPAASDAPELKVQTYTDALNAKQTQFNERFEETFGLEKRGFNGTYIKFAQAAMSNMIGGIGYFYGHSLVQSQYTSVPVPYWNGPLYSAVPSRSFFPRGFLWDEGFHNLLISKWNKELSADIIAHWLDLMNVEGWIPREQILGLEARAKVPSEFVVQKNTNANPPTLLLTLNSMVQDYKNHVPKWFEAYLSRIWPRLEVWYNWFNETQKGLTPGSFRWRGRNASAIFELNPKTLTSGLDDFPRASHPTDLERHVDLRCWMALASKLMTDIGSIIGKDASKYETSANYLMNNQLLDELHWSEDHGAYLDYGLHSEDVVLQKPRPQPGQVPGQKRRVVHEDPKYQFVNQVGYISLFPLVLEIIDANSPKLGKILQDLKNPSKLWTPYGLRSLSKSASIYMKKNTEHDAPYWRGPIWININFLTVRALHNYSLKDGPYKNEAKATYEKLKKALIDNVVKQYLETGYVWEQYNDRTGQGQGCRPFTGWSSLIVLMMGENF